MNWFEHLHKNKFFAFLDGFLCGTGLTLLFAWIYKNYLDEVKSKEIQEAEWSGYGDGMKDAQVIHKENFNCQLKTQADKPNILKY